MSDYIGSPNNEDPTTDFLARERAALGDDADFFTDDADLSPSPLPQTTATMTPTFIDSPDLPSPSAMLTPNITQEIDSIGTDQLIQQSNNASSFESNYPDTDALESSQAFHKAMLPDEEPETVRQWREKQKEILAERDEEAEKKKQETIKKRMKTLTNFTKTIMKRSKKPLKKTEQMTKDKDDSLSDGNVWERVLSHCDVSGTGGLSKTGDVTRMKEIMLDLKKTKDAPGNIV
ncbi:clathrin light chain [Absidia repens]|uniref:Clathrin light chain n=1 Tax=Absidia repens TaxID=90262 RepID=A0A1X2IEE7_9FUNG|nr:clathrin light chain [Absidia repens]